MNWLKKLLGIRNYRACNDCHMVYEFDNSIFWEYCPTCRKPYQDQYNLEQWAIMWTRRCPLDAKQIREKDLAVQTQANYARQQQWAEYQARAAQSQNGISSSLGLRNI